MGILDDLFKAAGGSGQIDGGCDSCTAYQTIEKSEPGIFHMIVHHDDWCPFLRARSAGAN